jgi:osmotically-inducible protein OsmY
MKFVRLVVCLVLLSGCTESQVNSAGSSIASSAPALANDALIVGQIEGAYVTIDPASALHVAVSSRDKFVAAAKKIDNVKDVNASLTVDEKLPGPKGQIADFGLAAAVQANVAGQAGINALSVHVAAHDGTVTLSGKVASDALRSTIVDAAKHVTGVRNVVDTLNVGT